VQPQGHRVRRLFSRAMDLPAEKRQDFLRKACGGDHEVYQSVISLIAELDNLPQSSARSASSNRIPIKQWGLTFLVLIVPLLALFVLTMGMKYDGTRKVFGWQSQRKGDRWIITKVDSDITTNSVQPGDHLLEFGGDSRVQKIGDTVYRRMLIPRSAYTLTIERGVENRRYPLMVHAKSVPRDLPSEIMYLSVAFGFWCMALALGFATGRKRPDKLGCVAGAVVAIRFVALASRPFHGLTNGFETVLTELIWLHTPWHLLLAYHFFYRFPVLQECASTFPKHIRFLYAGCAMLSSIRVVSAIPFIIPAAAVPTAYILYPVMQLDDVIFRSMLWDAIELVSFAAIVLVLICHYRPLSTDVSKKRMRSVMLAFMFVMVPLVFFSVGDQLLVWLGRPDILSSDTWKNVGEAANFAVILIPLTLAYDALSSGWSHRSGQKIVRAILIIPFIALSALVVPDLFHQQWYVVTPPLASALVSYFIIRNLRPGIRLMKECPICGLCYDNTEHTCSADGNVLMLQLAVERRIENYLLKRRLPGRGFVYEAEDLKLHRQVVVKACPDQLGETALARFQREAHALAQLNHPNVVPIYGYGQLRTGGAFFVMEWIDGLTWRAVLRDCPRVEPRRMAVWLTQLLNGLSAAHDRAIIHRDLKPENVLIRIDNGSKEGIVIIDFGIAKIHCLNSTTLTEQGVGGTISYMAPEQLTREASTPAADIFAIGVMVIEALTGGLPLRGENYCALLISRFDESWPACCLEEAAVLRAILSRCLDANPMRRYQNIHEFGPAMISALASISDRNFNPRSP
jgi:hypothetical protein